MEGSNNHNEGLTYGSSTPVGPDQPQSPGPSLIRDLEDGMARVETKKTQNPFIWRVYSIIIHKPAYSYFLLLSP